MDQVCVIIATSMDRTNLLIQRSLISIYKQTNIDSKLIKVIVVDDNESDNTGLPYTLGDIRNQISILRHQLNLPLNAFETFVLPNLKTKHHSGSGAWNTGIESAIQNYPKSYIAILDDDDEYVPSHIVSCLEATALNQDVVAVFQELSWQNTDGTSWHFPLTENDMNENKFFIGNPGIQGSNMFFKTNILKEIGRFDETLASCTDRDLMIRFFRYMNAQNLDIKSSIKIIHSIGVIHHNHSDQRVTNNNGSKQKSLERFYQKHRSNYSEEDYQASIARAVQLFNFNPIYEI